MRKASGALHFYINGIDQGEASENLRYLRTFVSLVHCEQKLSAFGAIKSNFIYKTLFTLV